MNYYNQNFYPNFNQAPVLKKVENVDGARAADIQVGNYGVFPKADFSEIYVKTWNNDGTIKLIAFKPDPNEIPKPIELSDVMDRLSALETKLDELHSDKNGKEKILNAF